MLKSRLAWLCCAILLCGLACSCSAQPIADKAPGSSLKIISIVPSATEMLVAMGLVENVIAVGDYDKLPPEAANLPRIGGLLNPNIEAIIELKPDLVITYGTQDVLRQRLESIGIRLYPFTHGSIRQTLDYMVDLGTTVGVRERALEIEKRIQATFDAVHARAPSTHPKVLLIHNRGVGVLGAFYSVGSEAFQHELIEIAGGVNLFGDVNTEVVQPTLEEIIARGPDIVIETLPSQVPDSEIAQRVSDWRTLSGLPAVVSNRIYVVAEDYLLVPGPRLDLAAIKLGEIISGN